MKLKYLIIAFSIIIVIVILVSVLFPVFLAESGYIENVQYIVLPLFIFIVLLLIFLGIFFYFNYRLFSLLEREDWPALAYYLEQKIYQKGSYSERNVKLLASSYLVMTDYLSVLKLENKAMLVKPSVVAKNVLIFGSARVLSGNNKEAAVFFKTHLDKGKLNEKEVQWVRWYYGFSQLLTGDFKLAMPEFISLAMSSRDSLITGLSAYFLQNTIAKTCEKEECLKTAENGKNRVKAIIRNPAEWAKEAGKMNTDIHIAIIRKYVDEAGKWIFAAV